MNTAPNVRIIPAKTQTAENRDKYHQLRVAAYCRVSTEQEEQQNSYQSDSKNELLVTVHPETGSERFDKTYDDCERYLDNKVKSYSQGHGKIPWDSSCRNQASENRKLQE